MSKFGETVDLILEFVGTEEKVSVHELKKKVSTNKAILELMKEYDLIEMNNGFVKITKFGSALLTAT